MDAPGKEQDITERVTDVNAPTLVADSPKALEAVQAEKIGGREPSWSEPPPHQKNHARPGDRIGEDERFEIIEQAGVGGMGLVFRARDRQLDRTVAIKFIIAGDDVSPDELTSALRQEARATARLAHENIVRIFDLGQWGGLPFLVIEYIEGEPLSSILKRERFDARKAIDMLLQIAHALEHAHAHGIIHRDLKPSNVLVLKDGKAKILDFGIAHFLESKRGPISVLSSRESPLPKLGGTPAYMAPEQWRADVQDERVDIWAAGVVFFEMLTGQLPAWTSNVHAFWSWFASPEPSPSACSIRPELSSGVDAIISRTIARLPADRYRSARAFIDALEALKTSLTPRSLVPPGPKAQGRSGPERRQLSVLAASLSGLDEDDVSDDEMSELLHAFHGMCTETVTHQGGCIATAVGGKLIACFGYPVAQEDDAQRAVKAALLIRDGMGALESALDRPLQVSARVGVHTGVVIVDAMAGELDRGIPVIQGEAPDVAARLSEKAEPGMVLMSQSTLALVPGLFAAELFSRAYGTKGGAKTPSSYRVERELKVASRFERVFSDLSAPLVGRETEVGCLLALWEEAKAGRGQIVLLSGDAGIGKSRLVQVLRQRADIEGHARMTCQCWPHFQGSALYPVIQLLLSSMEIAPEDKAPQKMEKIERALSALQLPLETHVPLIAGLLSVELCAPYQAPALTPERQKAKTLEAVAAMLLGMAAKRPVLLAVEDLHWIDHSTLELLSLLSREAPGAHLLMVFTFRPEFRSPWASGPNLQELALSRLSPALTGQMIEQAAAGKTLSREAIEQIALRTDGIPLFVEELTRMVLDAMDMPAEMARKTLPGLGNIAIPATLQELLLARLDRLSGPGKQVAQVASVIGRDFDYRLLRAVSSLDDAVLEEGLLRLCDAEIVFRQGRIPDAQYMFKHALLQEAAYQSLIRSTRQQYHLAVARTLSESYPEIAALQPELLAHHYVEGGDLEQSIGYWERAGARATQRSANIEAIGHYEKALELIGKTRRAAKDKPLPREAVKQELGICIAMGSPIMAIKGYAAPEVEKVYARARELCQSAGEDAQIFPSIAGLWQFYMVGGQIPVSRDLGQELLGIAEATQNTTFLVLAHRALATSRFLLGELEAAVDHTERGLRLYDAQKHGSLAFRHGHDPGVAHNLYAAWALVLLGRADEALSKANAAIALAEQLAHPLSLAFAYSYAAMTHQLRGEPKEALALAQKALPICTEHRFALWTAWATIQKGYARALLGELEEGLSELIRGSNGWLGTGARSGMTYFMALRADVLFKLGRYEEAAAVNEEAIETARRLSEHFNDAELLRQKAELWLAISPHRREEAGAIYRQGLEEARLRRAGLHESRLLEGLRALDSGAGSF